VHSLRGFVLQPEGQTVDSPHNPFGSFGASPSTEEHRAKAQKSVTCAVLTISDTRTKEDDRSGKLIRQHLSYRGHEVVAYEIVPDDAEQITEMMTSWIMDPGIEAIITNGGTGISGRDVTFGAITSLLDKELPGFGELFRMLSWDEIGAAAMLSRATAGVAGSTVIFSTPGSSNAVKLAMEKLIGPELAHIVHEMTK
jgi:molybdenum cofactor biosynthesis protein B